MTDYKKIFVTNLDRVDSLCNLYSKLKNEGENNAKDYKLTDMLRAATVLLHSSFEEYYRCVITHWLPIRGDEKTLESIVLPDDAGKKGNVKYTLYSLMEFKDQTIGDLFEVSINGYMSRTTFNNFSEICAWASRINLDLSEFKNMETKYYLDIDKAVSRRHKIVHEADTSRNGENERLNSIIPGNVIQWKEAYLLLVDAIDNQIEKW